MLDRAVPYLIISCSGVVNVLQLDSCQSQQFFSCNLFLFAICSYFQLQCMCRPIFNVLGLPQLVLSFHVYYDTN